MAISKITLHKSLPTGGYEDQLFLDLPPESPHCPVCLSVVREPHVLVCCGTPICRVSTIIIILKNSNQSRLIQNDNYYCTQLKFKY